jgi:Zn-finger nucleic acid-binding protein
LLAHPYYGPGNVVVDSCTTCDLIWLDFGELKQIVDAPGRDRGLREKGTPVTPLPDPTTTRAIGHGHSRTTATDVAAEGIAVFLELFS